MEDGDVYEELKRLRAENAALLEESCDLALDKVAAQSAALELAKVALDDTQWLSDGDVFAHNRRVQKAIAAIEALPAAPKGEV